MTTSTLAPTPAVRPAPAPPAAPVTRVRGLTAEATFIKRSIIHAIRTPDALIMATVFPIIMMFLFTYVFGGAFAADGSYVQYVVPGIILLCAGFGAASVAVDVAQDMTTGIIDRFRTMPIRASAVITGHIVTSLIRNLVATSIVIGVAIAVGFRPNATPLEWVAAFGLLFRLVSYAINRRSRDFDSTKQVLASNYQVLVPSDLTAQAKQIIATPLPE